MLLFDPQRFALVLICIFAISCSGDNDSPVLPIQKDLLAGDVVVKSHPYSPLARTLKFSSSETSHVSVRVKGINGKYSDVHQEFDDDSKEHEVLVLGLYPSHENTVDIVITSEDGMYYDSTQIAIATEELPDFLPEIEVIRAYRDEMDGQHTLVSHLSAFNPNIPFLIDSYGDIRWFLDYTSHPFLKNMFYDVGIERLHNGNLYFGTANVDQVLEIDMTGEVLNAWDMPGYDFHHNVQEKSDGNFLVTVSKYDSEHLNGNMTIEDYIIEIDRQSGDIINEWDLKESLNEWRTTLVDNTNEQYIDWVHVNAVLHDPSDNTIIVSGRHQALVKLDYNNSVQWIMGPHLDWGTNRRGDELSQYLLSPLDPSGDRITDPDLLNGLSSTSGFDWNWYQHAPMITAEGTIMLFDNGDNRNWGNGGGYSRAVEYAIDAEEMTVQQLWEFGKEVPQTFSPIISDVDQLPDSDHILFSPGHIVNGPSGRIEGRIMELDYITKQVVFDVRLICSPGRGLTFHRVEKMRLYPE